MSMYEDYLKEIEERKALGLHPKPLDGAELLSEVIDQIKDQSNPHRKDSLNFFMYNVLPGTTPAAGVKAKFLKEIILGEESVEEISTEFAFELLSHMKGGHLLVLLGRRWEKMQALPKNSLGYKDSGDSYMMQIQLA